MNVHSALLPSYRGMLPTFWAMVNEERETGVTVHCMSEGIDGGAIILQRTVPIGRDETLCCRSCERRNASAADLVLESSRVRSGYGFADAESRRTKATTSRSPRGRTSTGSAPWDGGSDGDGSRVTFERARAGYTASGHSTSASPGFALSLRPVPLCSSISPSREAAPPRGPVLFRQDPWVLHGRPFSMFKFRSMVASAPALGPNVSPADDPRVTRIGALLRKTYLDEMPQLLNVFGAT